MRVFVTGATGNIGSAVVKDLLAAGHQVVGLSRSKEKAATLAATGAEVRLGTLEDLDGLKTAAASADAVIHLAFNHDFSRFKANCEDDRAVINALGLGLAGSSRPLVVTSGTPIANSIPGEPAREGNPIISAERHPRAATEEAALAAAALGCNVSVVRLPQVHDPYKQGLITYLIATAREKGVSAYVGDGQSRWAAVHRLDAARVYRLALEKGAAGAKYHAVGEEGVSLRAIAESVGRGLKLPVVSKTAEEAAAHFGWMAMFLSGDCPVSSALTQQELGWKLSGQPSLIEDLDEAEFA